MKNKKKNEAKIVVGAGGGGASVFINTFSDLIH